MKTPYLFHAILSGRLSFSLSPGFHFRVLWDFQELRFRKATVGKLKDNSQRTVLTERCLLFSPSFAGKASPRKSRNKTSTFHGIFYLFVCRCNLFSNKDVVFVMCVLLYEKLSQDVNRLCFCVQKKKLYVFLSFNDPIEETIKLI